MLKALLELNFLSNIPQQWMCELCEVQVALMFVMRGDNTHDWLWGRWLLQAADKYPTLSAFRAAECSQQGMCLPQRQHCALPIAAPKQLAHLLASRNPDACLQGTNVLATVKSYSSWCMTATRSQNVSRPESSISSPSTRTPHQAMLVMIGPNSLPLCAMLAHARAHYLAWLCTGFPKGSTFAGTMVDDRIQVRIGSRLVKHLSRQCRHVQLLCVGCPTNRAVHATQAKWNCR